MKANVEFNHMSLSFWGYVRLLSEKMGYSTRKQDKLRRFEFDDVCQKLDKLEISYDNELIRKVTNYLNYRSDILNDVVSKQLMDSNEACEQFELLKRVYDLNGFTCNLPANKQKGEKFHQLYFTGIINILAEREIRLICSERNLDYGIDLKFNDSPSDLSCILDDKGKVVFTLSRRFDGAIPDTKNAKAVWEIKEYYHATTFGSRVADGVFETLLDGYEINSVEDMVRLEHGARNSIQHFYFIDAKHTWWKQGKSYLCRIIDMLNMGFVDEVMFGKEVLTEWPILVRSLF